MEEDKKQSPGPSKQNFVELPAVNKTALEVTSMEEDKKQSSEPSKQNFVELPAVNKTALETETMCEEFLELCSPMESMSMRCNDRPTNLDYVVTDITELNDCLDFLTNQLEYQNAEQIHSDFLVDCNTKLWKTFLETLMVSIKLIQSELSTFNNKELTEYLRQNAKMHGEEYRDLEPHWVKLMSYIDKTELEWTRLDDQITKLKKQIQEFNLKRVDVLIEIEENIKRIKMIWVELETKYYKIGLECDQLEEKINDGVLSDSE